MYGLTIHFCIDSILYYIKVFISYLDKSSKGGKFMLKWKKILIVLSCMMLQAVPYSMAQNVGPLFIKPLENAYTFDLQQIGYIFTIGAVVAAMVSPFVGKFFKKNTVKYVMQVGLIVSGLGIFMNSFAKNIGMLLLGSAITQIGAITFSGLGVPYLIANWFSKKEKAKALGIVFAGGTIGNFFLQPIVELLLNIYSVHMVYAICGITSIVVGSVIILIFINTNNSSENIQNIKINDKEPVLVEKGIGYKATMRLKSFWRLGFFYFLIGLSISALSTQYADYFFSIGVSKHIIGLIGSVFAASCLIGNLWGGILFAKLGVEKAMGTSFILQVLALMSIFSGLLNHNIAIIAGVGWAVFYGLNVFSYMSGPAIMMQNLFGMKGTSQILGTFSIFLAVGFALGNIVFGMFVYKFGFGIGWLSITCYTTIGFIGLLTVMKGIVEQNYAVE